ncbi:hypothetical protein [Synechococcus sp. CBW1004]|jgi:hypothetical protein|uniref:hypothetical protein n=1 Tax=Synechococcus sp. CBW1004 TaxID=1353136 RepID=UPI0018CE291A|nr:hypothetical protein [Synechococcus sp. CBW1004]QPN61927.1 hypothetical protein H8F25_08925 [Synechococcus sp. CBW1004]
MERWEYQVVHLNVEGGQTPPAGGPARQGPPAPQQRPEAVFSKEYLEKEFPGFYSSQPGGGSAQAKDHPANQLRTFLNNQGQQGWQLLGFFPVGQLTMIIFRRPQRTSPSVGTATSVGASPERRDGAPLPPAPEVATAPASPEAAAPAPPPSAPPQPSTELLARILERLEALERRLPAASSSTAEPDPWADLEDGAILPPQRWGELEDQPRLSTPAAARALGFRSAASLLNLAARNGYRQGLVKRGLASTLAVYMGSETSGRGDRHVWVVLPIPDS